MKLFIIERKRFAVAAYINDDVDGNGTLPAIDDLNNLASNYQGSAKGIRGLWKIYVEHGRLKPYGLTSEQMHHANYNPDILEFRRGKVRVFCFIDDGMVILTNAGLKKGQKANPKDVHKAIRIYTEYFADKAQGKIYIQERA